MFDPKRNPFLHGKKIGDEYIAKAIDLMAREDKEFIDYSTLGTRQLGSIYEGLLEYRLKVATEDLAAVKEKGHEKWITRKEAEGKKSFFEIRAGEIYLATDKGERKATGSYYTPDYIVKYIVRNTLTPILDERRITWKEKGLGERPFLHDILSIRVLDPAMGSGHFLVEACEFLANRLVEAWGEARPEDLESEEVAEHDVHWARREVVRHCIFGVDLNPMAVELAKLSLWLETVAANKPLTFLDHHLKVGNSLIGAKVEDLRSLPTKEKKEAAVNGKQLKTPTLWDFTVKKHFEELLAKYGEFAAHPDDDLRSVKLKEQEYDALQKSEINRRLHEMANAWVSSYFGAVPPPDEYAQMQNEMNPKDFPDWGKWREREWFRRAQEIAGEKRFFHWELEFPESFYEKGAPRENPGWDAVVGNPPYLRIQELQKVDSIQINFFNATFVSATSNYDIYVLFNEFGLECLKVDGRLGMIQPSKFIQADFGKGIRKILPKYLDAIIDFRENQIFDVSTYTCLLFLSKIDKQEWNYLAVPALRNVDVEMPIILDQKLDSSIISRNLTEAPWILSKQDNLNILKKLNVFPQQLKDVVTNIFQGIATSADHIYFLEEIERISADKIKLYSHSTNSEWILETTYLKPLLKGENVHRYEPLEPNIWRIFPYDISGQNPRLLSRDELKDNSPKLLEYLKLNEVELRNREHGRFNNDEWWQFSRPQNLMLYAKKKMMTPDICNKGEISYDNTGYCHTTTIYSFIFKDECQENILFWNSVLNSSLVWYFISNTGSILRGGFFRFKTNYLKPIPIRRISFTTPPDRRADLVEQAKALYSDFLGATDSDRINRMDRIDQAGNPVDPVNPVRTVASPGADSQKLLEFVGARLSSAPEESDVVHDLLAHLAERMIEMNREKNAEIKGFLRWLEGEIGAPVEDLTNKTALREYYAHDFEGFAGALAKNKKKLKSGYDPTRREPKEKLQDEFNASVGKLVPLLDKIDATDRLIDQIVYKLYGLNNDEIKIVEGSISGTKDLNTKENTK